MIIHDNGRKYKRMTERKPNLPTQSERYKEWWKKIKERKCDEKVLRWPHGKGRSCLNPRTSSNVEPENDEDEDAPICTEQQQQQEFPPEWLANGEEEPHEKPLPVPRLRLETCYSTQPNPI